MVGNDFCHHPLDEGAKTDFKDKLQSSIAEIDRNQDERDTTMQPANR